MSQINRPTVLFVFGAFRRQGGGLARAWYQRLLVMHEAGWDVQVALLAYRRYRRRTLAHVLGGNFPRGVKIHRFWNSPMNRIQVTTRFVIDLVDFALRKLSGKKILKLEVQSLTDKTQREWHYDRLGRLIAEVDRDMVTELSTRRVWYDTGGNWVLKEWFGEDEYDVTKVQRPSDLHPRSMVDARADWLQELGLKPGTVIVSDSPYTYPVVAAMPEKFGRVFVMHLNHLKRGEGPLGKLTPRMRIGLEPFYDRPDAVVVSTPDQAEDLKIRFGSDFPTTFIRPVVRKIEATVNIPRDPNLVVSLGRIVDVKRLHLAVQAIEIARNQVPGIRLEIWGAGPDRERIEELITERNLEQVVSFKGYTPHPENIFRSAAVSIHTSRRESFGLSIIESLMQGCPVVAFDVKYGPSSLIESGKNGYLIPDNDVNAFAKAVSSILTDIKLRNAMGSHGQKISKTVDHGLFKKEWNDLLTEVRTKALNRIDSSEK